MRNAMNKQMTVAEAGRKGGKERARRLSPDARKAQAAKAAQARWIERRALDQWKADDNGCHIWQWTIDKKTGYGRCRIGAKLTTAHRAAWLRSFGEIPHGLLVLHKCDVRACVNPDHLWLGTQKDNIRDAIAKGR